MRGKSQVNASYISLSFIYSLLSLSLFESIAIETSYLFLQLIIHKFYHYIVLHAQNLRDLCSNPWLDNVKLNFAHIHLKRWNAR